MLLEDYDLRQIDEATLRLPSKEDLRTLSTKLLQDLKEARERLNQSPNNSSRPPSSRVPWEKNDGSEQSEVERSPVPEDEEDAPRDDDADAEKADPKKAGKPSKEENGPRRKPGKQPGSPGHGRTQVIAITGTVDHRPDTCALCNGALPHGGVPWTAFDTVDIEKGEGDSLGIRVTNTRNVYCETACACGHTTRANPHRADDDPLWDKVALTEWRLVGPTLCALIVALTFRSRMSRARVREFLSDWLGVTLSIGTLQRCIEEAARATDPVEDQLIEDILASELLYADETPHKEGGLPQWLWGFISASTVLFYVGYRTKEIFENLLGSEYQGWLMSDGYAVYRKYSRRLRCWAHLLRKARGLEESLDRPVQAFGNDALELMNTLMDAIYRAREGPHGDLKTIHAQRLEQFRAACLRMQKSSHDKAHALAVEFLNDWEAIFRVLEHPHLPLTNNEAERALRHWVIWRRISYGTRTPVGSKSFALLASVIDTCRRRNASPWPYLAQVIAAGRRGLDVPRLPHANSSPS
jgi:transposase